MPGHLNTTTDPKSQGRFHRDSGYGYRDTGHAGDRALSGYGVVGSYVRHRGTPTDTVATTGVSSAGVRGQGHLGGLSTELSRAKQGALFEPLQTALQTLGGPPIYMGP